MGKNEITLSRYEFCWRCGRDFNQDVLLERKTYHHAIPQVYSPKYNVKLPVCQECHYDINPLNDKAILAFIKRMKKTTTTFLEKYDPAKGRALIVSEELKKLIKETKK